MRIQVRVTKRELAVLASYVRGGGTRDAAAELGITENTTRAHLTTIRRRVRASNTAQAVWLLRDDLEPLLGDMPPVGRGAGARHQG